MNKLDMESKDIVKDNLEYIKERFPEAVTEENGELKLNPDSLIQSLSSVIIDDKKEKYELTWPGKKQAIVEGNTRTTKTLRPLKDKSVNFDKTENIYIEGDNLEALKILQESYLHKVKFIYIDPPYNTGNDFIYKDNFDKTSREELIESGQIDEIGNRLVTNNSSNGRFHSDWLSMMYPRLKLARNLLSDDGVIFISIDDTENANLQKICEEIFNANNYEHFIWKKKGGAGNTEKIIGCLTENILCYFKNKKPGDFNYQKFEREYKYSDDYGKYNLEGIEKTNLGTYARPTMLFDIIDPKTNEHFKPSINMRWTLGLDTINKKIEENKLFFDYEKKKVYVKKYENDYENSQNVFYNLLTDYGSLATAKEEINGLFGNRELFDTPKPTELLKHLLMVASKPDSIILDFFSGSASMAEATMRLNSEDNGNRKFIMIQIPEECNQTSEAFKEGFSTICDIGEERIRRAARKIKDETNADIDYGFRVYKIDDSNMKDEFYMTPDRISQEQIKLFEDNIKEDRTPDDLITQVLLDLGLKLDLPIEEKNICGNKVFDVDDGELLACFDSNVSIDIIEEIAKINPRQVVFRDSSFATDQDKVNFEERLKRLSAGTKFNVL